MEGGAGAGRRRRAAVEGGRQDSGRGAGIGDFGTGDAPRPRRRGPAHARVPAAGVPAKGLSAWPWAWPSRRVPARSGDRPRAACRRSPSGW
ncbi:hypothetical protein [Lysobacter gummosus]|uniref:hypothetical protein n=1 Tax=Lysobacter gummosus TaxID=262324 RepID=UPI003624B5D1